MNRLALLLTLLMTSPALYAAENKMFEKMRTYCFGRYLVDIPNEAEFKGQGNNYQGASIKSERGGEGLLKQKIEKRLAELKKGSSSSDYFEFNKEIVPSKNSHLLVGYQVAFGSPMYSIDSFKLDKGWVFSTSKSPYSPGKINSILERFDDYLQSIRYRSEREAPREAGFCIENGFIANNGETPQFEMASITFALKNNSDVWFSIDSFTLSKPGPSLLERQKAAKLDEKFPGKIKAIKKGARTVNGMQGEESLNEFPSDNGMGVAHSFMWEAQGGFDNPLNPKVSIQLTSGEGIAGVTGESSLNAAQMQRLYESVINSIRVRPTAQ
ncbi:T6SS immunity protein Tli4 family protein [Chromobacterium sp. Panama]|uniref:T6SS immunity protein Tli4 family protein n=1 Tax=Chromobacterium sp. Panama TaxID=2161826 RepID=UPI0011B1D0BE|nr:T6SS immunity protein Tli4 family protein [Chromobacterium sp. Panama]